MSSTTEAVGNGRDLAPALACRAARWRSTAMRCSPASTQHDGDRAVLHVALRTPPVASCTSTARTSSATCRPSWVRWVTSLTASGRVVTGRRQADRRGRQHRDRWLGPRPPHGHRRPGRLRVAEPNQPLRANVDPVDLYSPSDPVPRDDPLRHQLQDLHHRRETDQRRSGPGTGLAAAGLGSVAGDDAVAKHFGWAVSTNATRGGGVGNRHRQHARVLGLGRRPILRPLGHRLLPHGGDRPRGLRRDAGRLPCRRRALPDHAPGRERSGHSGDVRTSGTTTSSARRRTPCCRTATGCPVSRPICSS